jgi:AAA15 family ATPase/GTPase
MLGLHLCHLIAVGRKKEPARLDFARGLNVIYGAANTGKTHVLHLIDFALGASASGDAPPDTNSRSE